MLYRIVALYTFFNKFWGLVTVLLKCVSRPRGCIRQILMHANFDGCILSSGIYLAEAGRVLTRGGGALARRGAHREARRARV